MKKEDCTCEQMLENRQIHGAHQLKLCKERQDYFALFCRRAIEKAEAFPNRSKGLGDTVEKILGKLGIKQRKKGCGCGKRRDWLNKVVPYKKKKKGKEKS